jgi:hypothetical protein
MRALVRALLATLLGLAIVWLVTAASDEGQLTVGARAGRTLPLAPLCSAVGAALALGTSRVRQEAIAFEALGRSPAEIGRAAALGAALPSIVVALAMAAVPAVDVGSFYPRAIRGDTFLYTPSGFTSPTLGVTVDDEGETHAIDTAPQTDDAELPKGARNAAAAATALAGLALALIAARTALRQSLLDEAQRRRVRVTAAAEGVGCIVLTLMAFQAAAARIVPAALAIVPPAVLLGAALVRLRWGYGGVDDRRIA